MDLNLVLRLITTACAITTLLCVLFTAEKVKTTTKHIVLRLANSKKIKISYFTLIGVFCIMGTTYSFFTGILIFLKTANVYSALFSFLLMLSATASFAYTSYKLAY